MNKKLIVWRKIGLKLSQKVVKMLDSTNVKFL
jgi:hypothetical protein